MILAIFNKKYKPTRPLSRKIKVKRTNKLKTPAKRLILFKKRPATKFYMKKDSRIIKI